MLKRIFAISYNIWTVKGRRRGRSMRGKVVRNLRRVGHYVSYERKHCPKVLEEKEMEFMTVYHDRKV